MGTPACPEIKPVLTVFVQTLREFLGGKKDVAALIGAGVVPSLTENLHEEDPMCRALAVEAMGDLATTSGRAGCAALVGTSPVSAHFFHAQRSVVRTAKTLAERPLPAALVLCNACRGGRDREITPASCRRGQQSK